MVYFPRADIVLLDMSVDQAMKLIISCGVIVPPEKNAELPRLKSNGK